MGEAEFQAVVLDKLENIHIQVTKTNGKVVVLEAWRECTEPRITSLTAWRDRLAGGLAVVLVILIPIGLDLVRTFLSRQ
jgi:hypothetical protein